jgi:uncharacterized protein
VLGQRLRGQGAECDIRHGAGGHARCGRRVSRDAVGGARAGGDPSRECARGRRGVERFTGRRERAFGGQQAARKRGDEEGRRAEACSGRGSQLRGGNLLGRYEKEDSVTLRGVGLGLRWEFLDDLVDATVAGRLPIDFLEISPENYMRRAGRYPAALAWLAERYPLVTHGLTMSLGGVDPLDDIYLRDLAGFLRDTGTPWHSDHLCFGAVGGRALHDLLPVAFTKASVDRVAERIRRARDAIELPLAIENVSYYWHPGRREMREAEVLASVCEAADCALLFDVNNAYVNMTNFGVDADEWLKDAPLERVVQIHVAGHEWFSVDGRGLGDRVEPHAPGAMIIDTHGADVADPVMALLKRVLVRTGPVPVVLERDENVPSLDALLDELARIRTIWLDQNPPRAEVGE